MTVALGVDGRRSRVFGREEKTPNHSDLVAGRTETRVDILYGIYYSIVWRVQVVMRVIRRGAAPTELTSVSEQACSTPTQGNALAGGVNVLNS